MFSFIIFMPVVEFYTAALLSLMFTVQNPGGGRGGELSSFFSFFLLFLMFC